MYAQGSMVAWGAESPLWLPCEEGREATAAGQQGIWVIVALSHGLSRGHWGAPERVQAGVGHDLSLASLGECLEP